MNICIWFHYILTDMYSSPSVYSMYKSFIVLCFIPIYTTRLLTVNLTKIIWFFNSGLISTRNYHYILAFTTLKMTKWVVETHNKITLIHWSASVGLSNDIFRLDQCCTTRFPQNTAWRFARNRRMNKYLLWNDAEMLQIYLECREKFFSGDWKYWHNFRVWEFDKSGHRKN